MGVRSINAFLAGAVAAIAVAAVVAGQGAAIAMFVLCVGAHAALQWWAAGQRKSQPEDEDMDLLTWGEAQEAKDAVLERAASNDIAWSKRARAAILALPDGFVGIGEQFTKAVIDAGVGAPERGAMGPVILALVRRGVLVETGVYRAMQKKGSNARRSVEYVKRTPEAIA